jgi:DNA repair protein REV1
VANISKEVVERLNYSQIVGGKCVTLKLMVSRRRVRVCAHRSDCMQVRAADAPVEPSKYMGHGPCDVFSKSITLTRSTNNAEEIGEQARRLWRKMDVCVIDVRGVCAPPVSNSCTVAGEYCAESIP